MKRLITAPTGFRVLSHDSTDTLEVQVSVGWVRSEDGAWCDTVQIVLVTYPGDPDRQGWHHIELPAEAFLRGRIAEYV